MADRAERARWDRVGSDIKYRPRFAKTERYMVVGEIVHTGARRRARIYTDESKDSSETCFTGEEFTIPSVLRCKIKWCSGPSLFRRGQVAATGNYYLRILGAQR